MWCVYAFINSRFQSFMISKLFSVDSDDYERSNFPASRHHAYGDQTVIRGTLVLLAVIIGHGRGKKAYVGKDTRKLGGVVYLLPSYIVQLLKVDPGTPTCLVLEGNRSFLRFFWAFGPCFCSYKIHLNRVICMTPI